MSFDGFNAKRISDVRLRVGETLTPDVSLDVAGQETVVQVVKRNDLRTNEKRASVPVGGHRDGRNGPRPLIIERQAIRAIVLSEDREILLLRIRPPQGGDWFWITPGGGLEPGETAEEGLRRELREELGLEQFQMGPLVWRRQHTFNWAGKRLCQREQYHIVHAARFEPRMSDVVEAKVLDRFRWWPVTELAHAREPLTPTALADIVARYFAQGPPADVPDVEVLVD